MLQKCNIIDFLQKFICFFKKAWPNDKYTTFIINNKIIKGVINMNIKKIGLTALAGSLVVTSAHAGAMSASGTASMALKNDSNTQAGKSWTMGNSVILSGGGELDNGINVSLSFELDSGVDTGTGLVHLTVIH